MNLFIVVTIVLFLIGSVMWVMPSARMKELGMLRQLAISHGLTLKQLSADDLSSLFGDIESTRVPMAYGIRVRSRSNKQWHACSANHWKGHELEETEFKLLESAPGVSHVISRPGELLVLWNERGGKEELEKILELAKSLELSGRE